MNPVVDHEFDDLCSRIKEKHRFFRYLDQEERRIAASFLSCLQVESGSCLWNEDDESDYAAFVIEGRIEIKKRTEFAGKHVIVGIYSAGSLVGELCLFSENKRAVTATALTDALLVKLTSEGFDALLDAHPEIGAKLLKGMFLAVSHRLRRSYQRLASIF